MRITDRLQPLAAAGIIAASFIATEPPKPNIPPSHKRPPVIEIPTTPSAQDGLILTDPSRERSRLYLKSLSVPNTLEPQKPQESQSPIDSYPWPNNGHFEQRPEEPGIAA